MTENTNHTPAVQSAIFCTIPSAGNRKYNAMHRLTSLVIVPFDVHQIRNFLNEIVDKIVVNCISRLLQNIPNLLILAFSYNLQIMSFQYFIIT